MVREERKDGVWGRMSFRIVRGARTDRWLTKGLRKCTFPILNPPAKTSDDITGSAFLLHYQDIPYIVTAAHVVNKANSAIAFSTKSRKIVSVKTSLLQGVGLDWIKHPANLDLAAIPLHIPLTLVKDLDIYLIRENMWSNAAKISVGNEVAHLGYPQRGTSNYSDGKKSGFPQGMPGKIIGLGNLKIVTETAAAHGASGGPLFLKKDDGMPHLIGVVVSTKVLGNPDKPKEYLNETTSLPISLVKDIFESQEMKKQYAQRKIPSSWC